MLRVALSKLHCDTIDIFPKWIFANISKCDNTRWEQSQAQHLCSDFKTPIDIPETKWHGWNTKIHRIAIAYRLVLLILSPLPLLFCRVSVQLSTQVLS